MSKFRILPFVMAVAGLALVVKMDLAWTGIRGMMTGAIVISVAHASQSKNEDAHGEHQPDEGQHEGTKDSHKSGGGDHGTESADAHGDADAGQGSEGGGANEHGAHSLTAPESSQKFSEREVEVLQRLAHRRETLDTRERTIQERDALLRAAETRIDQKILELKDLKATLEQLIDAYDEQQTAKIQSLVKIYEAMKPKDAARILEGLEMDTLLLVAEHMKERKLASIMAQMNPQRAKDITVELARLRQLPIDGTPDKRG
ncbi:MAG: hypothetical protein KIT00_00895 [Rhodospirillales bacterium]|nr:hypothetical protein [Rhodospirillales bacterium]